MDDLPVQMCVFLTVLVSFAAIGVNFQSDMPVTTRVGLGLALSVVLAVTMTVATAAWHKVKKER